MTNLPKSLIFNLLLLFSPQILRGQNPAHSSKNLVINYSFEQRTETKNRYQTIDIVDTIGEFFGWRSPTAQQGEVFTTDNSGYIFDITQLERPFNAVSGKNVGSVEPHGILDRLGKRPIFKRSYLEGELKTPLEIGQKYYVGFFLHFHCLGTNNVGLAFALKENLKDTSPLLRLSPVVYSKPVHNYDKNFIWLPVVDSFIADQTYSNFYIGNFFPDRETATGGSIDFGHYVAYVDDIFVIKGSDSKMPPPKPPKAKPTPSLPKVLNRVQFLYNSADFEPFSFPQLDSAVLTLQRFPNLKLLIKGHTSAEGATEHNQKLSESRAEAVKNYLISKGIAAERLQTRGFGATQPLVTESSETDRRLNRRIEFEILSE